MYFAKMMIDVKQTANLLKSSNNILVLAHANPDGDTLGGGYALVHALRAIGKSAALVCNDKINSRFSFMQTGLTHMEFKPEMIVAVDVADTKLLGSEFEPVYENRIDLCIDHHASNTGYAKNTLLQPDAAAVAETVFEVIEELNVPITPVMADCLYTGISTDTGCFRYFSTTANSHLVAAKLITAGAQTGEINRVFFETKARTYAALERLALDKQQLYFNGLCAVITLTQKMYEMSGADESDIERITTLPRQIEGVLVGITLKEQADGSFKASVRTHSPINAAKLCGRLGGGGHSRAAGCRVEGPLDYARQTVLNEVRVSLKNSE